MSSPDFKLRLLKAAKSSSPEKIPNPKISVTAALDIMGDSIKILYHASSSLNSTISDLVNFKTISLMILLCIILALFLKQRIDKRIQKFFKPTQRNEQIMKHLQGLLSSYSPTLWLPGSYSKVYFTMKQKHLNPQELFKREVISAEDGEELVVDIYPQDHKALDPKSPIIIMAPGVNGSSESFYCKKLIDFTETKTQTTWRTIIYNRRGFIGIPIKGKKVSQIDTHEDLRQVIEVYSSRFPEANIYLQGLSLGSSNILKCLQLYQNQMKIKAVGLIAAPWNHHETTKMVVENKIIDKGLTNNLLDVHKSHLDDQNYLELLRSKGIDPGVYEEIKGKTDFDEKVLAIDSGFTDLGKYYDFLSTHQSVEDLNIPILSIQSLDDIVVPVNAVPTDSIIKNPKIIQLITRGGGHVGFYSGYKPKMVCLIYDPENLGF